MEKNVWWQAIKLFYLDKIIDKNFLDNKVNIPGSILFFMLASMCVLFMLTFTAGIDHCLGWPLPFASILLLGSYATIYIPLLLYALYYFICVYLPRRIVGTEDSIKSYFADLFSRATKTVESIQKKEGTDRKKKICRQCKETIERYTDMLRRKDLDGEHRKLIVKNIQGILKIEGLTLHDPEMDLVREARFIIADEINLCTNEEIDSPSKNEDEEIRKIVRDTVGA